MHQKPPKDVDVAMIAPKARDIQYVQSIRQEREHLVLSPEQDATGKVWDLALAYGLWNR